MILTVNNQKKLNVPPTVTPYYKCEQNVWVSLLVFCSTYLRRVMSVELVVVSRPPTPLIPSLPALIFSEAGWKLGTDEWLSVPDMNVAALTDRRAHSHNLTRTSAPLNGGQCLEGN